MTYLTLLVQLPAAKKINIALFLYGFWLHSGVYGTGIAIKMIRVCNLQAYLVFSKARIKDYHRNVINNNIINISEI